MNIRLMRMLLAMLIPALSPAWAGPLNTLVVINRASRDSRALGAYYAQRHGIPDSHICTIRTSARSPSISRAAFERDVHRPIREHIARHGLEGQIHFLVLCMGMPSRVENFNGITAALYYGYKAEAPNAPRCNIAPDSVNQYFGAETAYRSSAGWNRTHAPIAFLLTAPNLSIAKEVVDRAVASRGAFPEGRFFLYGSSDAERNVRARAYPAVARLFALFGQSDRLDVRPDTDPVPEAPVLGFMTGRGHLPEAYRQMIFAPGAIAEHMTSCAGMIPDPCYNQSSVWDWMRLGATASYGTVSEPCNFREKFPEPMVHFWYSRGFTAGEALAMSVRNPYQGLWVGDPLAAPFAAPPAVAISSPDRHSEHADEVTLGISVAAHEHGAPPVFLDLYVDGRHHAPIARPIAPVGNEMIARIGPHEFTYTVAPSEDLFGAVAGLAWAVNARGGGHITAKAISDRIEFTVQHPVDEDGEPWALSIETREGFAPARYIGGSARTDRLVINGGIGRAAAVFHLGTRRAYDLEYPLDLSGLAPGLRRLTVVARDGTAVQCQGQAELPIRISAPAGDVVE